MRELVVLIILFAIVGGLLNSVDLSDFFKNKKD